MLNEADTRAKLIDPKPHEAGWDEQKRPIAYVENLKQRGNELQCLQSQTENELEQITQSILTTAFRGDL